MLLKVDENLSPLLAIDLRALGHDVHTAADEGLLGHSDEQVAAAARAEKRMILTLDLGFGDERRFPPGRRPAIVVFRPGVYDIRFVRALVLRFVQSPDALDIDGATVIVEPHRTRVRRPEAWDDPRLGEPEDWKEHPLRDMETEE